MSMQKHLQALSKDHKALVVDQQANKHLQLSAFSFFYEIKLNQLLALVFRMTLQQCF